MLCRNECPHRADRWRAIIKLVRERRTIKKDRNEMLARVEATERKNWLSSLILNKEQYKLGRRSQSPSKNGRRKAPRVRNRKNWESEQRGVARLIFHHRRRRNNYTDGKFMPRYARPLSAILRPLLTMKSSLLSLLHSFPIYTRERADSQLRSGHGLPLFSLAPSNNYWPKRRCHENWLFFFFLNKIHFFFFFFWISLFFDH